MRCQECGKKLKKNESFCTSCGFYNKPEKLSLENDELGQLEYFKDPYQSEEEDVELLDEDMEEDDSKYQDFIADEVDYDSIDETGEVYSDGEDEFEHYLEAYIGEDYKLVAKRPINTYALLFSWMYFLYRKMYLIGILGLVITGFVMKSFPSFLPYYIVISMIVSGLLFNPFYLTIARGKVEKILDNNSGSDPEELEDICIRKGGVNTPVALLIFCIFLAIMFLSYLKIDYGAEKPKFWKENTENQANCILMTKNAFQMLDSEKDSLFGVFEDAVCHVVVTQRKNYDIYIRMKDGSVYQYYYIKNNGKSLTLEGDTSKIDKWEKEKRNQTILEEEEKMLTLSKELPNLFDTMIRKNQEEENSIKLNRNNSERVYYYFKSDEIYR